MAERYNLSRLAGELEMDRRQLERDLDGLAPDEEIERGSRTERRWKLRRVIEHIFVRKSGRGDHDNDPRNRLAAAQAEKHEMENELRRGELLDRAEVSAVWAEHIVAARAKLLSLPTKLGPQLLNVSDPNLAASRIRAEIYAALNELAADGSDERAPGPGGNGQHLAQSADVDSQPVG